MPDVAWKIFLLVLCLVVAFMMFKNIEIIKLGGPVMIPIILCSFFSFALVVERLFHLHRADIDTRKFMEEIADTLRRNRMLDAIEKCDNTPGPIAYILKAGILKHDRTKQEIKEAIEEAGLHEIPRLERNVNFLATIAQVSTLLGLLGTVTGMVRCFQVIQAEAAALRPINPGQLAGGIWEALITTVAGLVVAIPTLVAYNYLVSRINGFILEIERSATDLINLLSRRREGHEI